MAWNIHVLSITGKPGRVAVVHVNEMHIIGKKHFENDNKYGSSNRISLERKTGITLLLRVYRMLLTIRADG